MRAFAASRVGTGVDESLHHEVRRLPRNAFSRGRGLFPDLHTDAVEGRWLSAQNGERLEERAVLLTTQPRNLGYPGYLRRKVVWRGCSFGDYISRGPLCWVEEDPAFVGPQHYELGKVALDEVAEAKSSPPLSGDVRHPSLRRRRGARAWHDAIGRSNASRTASAARPKSSSVSGTRAPTASVRSASPCVKSGDL